MAKGVPSDPPRSPQGTPSAPSLTGPRRCPWLHLQGTLAGRAGAQAAEPLGTAASPERAPPLAGQSGARRVAGPLPSPSFLCPSKSSHCHGLSPHLSEPSPALESPPGRTPLLFPKASTCRLPAGLFSFHGRGLSGSFLCVPRCPDTTRFVCSGLPGAPEPAPAPHRQGN